jgi:hypothetical protein
MKQFKEEIVEAQRREGVRVITPPHALGFLDPNLPWSKRKEPAGLTPVTSSKETSGVRQSEPAARSKS